MKEIVRTLFFVGIALAAVVLAWFVNAGSQPVEAEAFAKVGTEFYPDFTDPTKAGSIEITSYDKATKDTQDFKVEFARGRWRIPSHHGYPADAKDRLEKAAISLIGITRQALAGRRANSHERFGVVAPPETDSPAGEDPLEGVGQRITLKDKAGNVLADLILGKRVVGQEDLYFVRAADEDETYRAKVNLNVSTKFGDWVEKDLLKLDRDNLLSMEIKTVKFGLAETTFGVREVLIGEESLTIHRSETGTGSKWHIDDLNAKTEEINTTGVGSIQAGLDSLELKGVRPKPKGLTPSLTLDPKLFPNDKDPNQLLPNLARDLKAKGFPLAMLRSEGAKMQFALFGKGGDFTAKTNEGLIYHMHFGNAFNGTEKDIEVGKTEVADVEGNEVDKTDQPAEPEAADKSKTTLNRYLFIRVEFDQSLMGKAPEKPVMPEKPEGLKDDEKPKPTEKTDNKTKTPEELAQEQLKRDYEAKMTLYRSQEVAYREDNKAYQKKLKEGKAKVDELNNRFGEWYYVIPETSYENLKFTRADVVQEKKQAEPNPSHPPFGGGQIDQSLLKSLLDKASGAMKTPAKPNPAVADKPKPQPAQAEKP